MTDGQKPDPQVTASWKQAENIGGVLEYQRADNNDLLADIRSQADPELYKARILSRNILPMSSEESFIEDYEENTRSDRDELQAWIELRVYERTGILPNDEKSALQVSDLIRQERERWLEEAPRVLDFLTGMAWGLQMSGADPATRFNVLVHAIAAIGAPGLYYSKTHLEDTVHGFARTLFLSSDENVVGRFLTREVLANLMNFFPDELVRHQQAGWFLEEFEGVKDFRLRLELSKSNQVG